MLQKKGKKPVGYGSIVYTTTEYDITKYKRKTSKGSKIKYFGYHCEEDGYIVVGGFLSANKQKYYKILPLRRNSAGTYVNFHNIAIINSKFVLESERSIKTSANANQLKYINDEANRRFGREFTTD